NEEVNNLCYSNEGSILASSSSDNTIRLWDIATGNLINKFRKKNELTTYTVCFNHHRSIMAIGGSHDTVNLHDIYINKLKGFLKEHIEPVNKAFLNHEKLKLLNGKSNDFSYPWDNGNLEAALKEHKQSVVQHKKESFDPISFTFNTTVSDSDSYNIRLWEVVSGKLLYTLEGHGDWIGSLCFNPDGTILANGSGDNNIYLWDVNTGKLINTLAGHNGSVYCVCFGPDGTILASGSSDNTIRLWEVVSGKLICTLEGHISVILCLDFNPDGSILASGSRDHSLKLWDMKTKTLLWTSSPQLFCKGANFKNVFGISESNRRLLEQRGASFD
ncbi:MAG: WD40 repeat domain-containing protein, partial [Candidatus Hodarchaeota archaeon]